MDTSGTPSLRDPDYVANLVRRSQEREAAMRPEADRLIDQYRDGAISLEDLAIGLTDLDETTELPD